MKKIYLLLFVLLVLSACSGPITAPDETKDSVKIQLNKVTVEMTSEGFSPNPVNINAGDTVVFLNKDTVNHWPASAVHPTHEELPGFDALGPVKPDESYEFTFSEKGNWRFHDHLNPAKTGVVVAA